MSACALSPLGAAPAGTWSDAPAPAEEEPASAEELREWIDSAPVTRPLKNFARDLSDGVLVAEIVHHYCPRLVDLHNYAPANSRSVKTYNWMTLNAKVFRKLHFQVPKLDIEAVVSCTPGAAERVLTTLRSRIEERRARSQARAAPTWDIRAEWGGAGRPVASAARARRGWQTPFGPAKLGREGDGGPPAPPAAPTDGRHRASADPRWDGRFPPSADPHWDRNPTPSADPRWDQNPTPSADPRWDQNPTPSADPRWDQNPSPLAGAWPHAEQGAWPPSRAALSELAGPPLVEATMADDRAPYGARSPDAQWDVSPAAAAATHAHRSHAATPTRPPDGSRSPPSSQRCDAASPFPQASPPPSGDIAALREANALLEIKVQKLEALLRLKNAKIAALSSALAVAGQPQAH